MNKRAAKVTEKKIREKKKERKSAWVAEAIPQEILIPGLYNYYLIKLLFNHFNYNNY